MPMIGGVWYDDPSDEESNPETPDVPDTPETPVDPKPMTQSILLTVKKMLGIAEEYHAFDIDTIININSVFLTLNQLGVGPRLPFQITGDEEVWSDFADPNKVPGIQTYVYLKTRLLFDPPTNSFIVDSIKNMCAEFEWRFNVQVEVPPKEDPSEEPPQNADDENQNGSSGETDLEVGSIRKTAKKKTLMDLFS